MTCKWCGIQLASGADECFACWNSRKNHGPDCTCSECQLSQQEVGQVEGKK